MRTPAVVLPPGLNAEGSFPSFSAVVPARIPSSFVTVIGFSSPGNAQSQSYERSQYKLQK